MSEPKWMSFAKANPDREYLALMSYLPLKKFRMIPRFISYTREIQTQLSQAKGLIGYSLRAKPLRRAFWTLSVWENENALMEFVSNPPHHHVMTAPGASYGQDKLCAVEGDGFGCAANLGGGPQARAIGVVATQRLAVLQRMVIHIKCTHTVRRPWGIAFVDEIVPLYRDPVKRDFGN